MSNQAVKFRVNEAGIPRYMRDQARFCFWRLIKKDNGDVTKIPFNPNAPKLGAQTNHPETFGTLAQAMTACQKYGGSGIGVNLQDGLWAIDVDHCIDAQGHMSEMAIDIIKTKRNKTLWRGTSIRSLIGNPVYIGILRFGDERSIPFEHLRIVSDEMFVLCLSMVKERAPKHAKNRTIPLRTDTHGLLTGLLFCGECGNRLSYGHSYTRKITSSGEHIYHREYYRCYRKLSSNKTCKGPTTYTAYPIDNAVISVVRGFFENMREAASPKMLELANKRTCSVIKDAYDKAEAEYESIYRKMGILEEEAVKALSGNSKLDLDTISSMIPKCRAQLEGAKAYLADMRKKLEKEEASKDGQAEKLKQILSWGDMFDQANTETKHMILAKLIERVDVSANGQIQIKFRLTAKEYLGEQPDDVTCDPKKVS